MKQPEPKSRKDIVSVKMPEQKYEQPRQMMVDVSKGTIMAKSKYVMNKVTKPFGQPRVIDFS